MTDGGDIRPPDDRTVLCTKSRQSPLARIESGNDKSVFPAFFIYHKQISSARLESFAAYAAIFIRSFSVRHIKVRICESVDNITKHFVNPLRRIAVGFAALYDMLECALRYTNIERQRQAQIRIRYQKTSFQVIELFYGDMPGMLLHPLSMTKQRSRNRQERLKNI